MSGALGAPNRQIVKNIAVDGGVVVRIYAEWVRRAFARFAVTIAGIPWPPFDARRRDHFWPSPYRPTMCSRPLVPLRCRWPTPGGMLISLDCVEQEGEVPLGRWTVHLGDHVRDPSFRPYERAIEGAEIDLLFRLGSRFLS